MVQFKLEGIGLIPAGAIQTADSQPRYDVKN